MTAPLLVLGWGNLSRGDDALGPLFVRQLGELVADEPDNRVDFLEDYQLQIEHAIDLKSREHVLFVDASLNCKAPFEVTTLHAACEVGFTTHALSPAAVMQVYGELYGQEAPPCTMLAIRGMRFALGEAPGREALDHLAQALLWGQRWLKDAAASDWPAAFCA